MSRLLRVRLAFLFALFSAFGLCNAELQNRAEVCTYSCPLNDADYMPVGLGSGPSNNNLRCTYPPLWNCQYDAVGYHPFHVRHCSLNAIISQTTGILLLDRDEGYCYITAICSTTSCECPPYDRDFFYLGPGSQVHGSILFCTYPTARGLNYSAAFCNYNMVRPFDRPFI